LVAHGSGRTARQEVLVPDWHREEHVPLHPWASGYSVAGRQVAGSSPRGDTSPFNKTSAWPQGGMHDWELRTRWWWCEGGGMDGRRLQAWQWLERGVYRGVPPAMTEADQLGLLGWHRPASSASGGVGVEEGLCPWEHQGFGGCSVTWLTAAWRHRLTWCLCVHTRWSVLGGGVSERPMWGRAWVTGVGRDAGRHVRLGVTACRRLALRMWSCVSPG